MAKIEGAYIVKEDIDKILRPLLKKSSRYIIPRDDQDPLPDDAKLISVWFDNMTNRLFLTYEHESFENKPKQFVMDYKYTVELDD